MRIQQATVSLSAHHRFFASQERDESLKAWIGDRTPTNTGTARPTSVPATGLRDTLTVSPEARSALEAFQANRARSGNVYAVDDSIDGLTPRDHIVIIILERMFGIKFHFVRRRDLAGDPDQADQNAQALAKGQSQRGIRQALQVGWGLDYQVRERYQESEQTSFSGQGVINTADGKQISFSIQLNMSRQFYAEHSISVKGGDALIDPLVINYGGGAAGLSPDATMRFDLNMDGAAEAMPLLRDGSGYLALDRNGDGTMNDGAELFGPTKGDGFLELQQYDIDSNNWIDENDPIYRDLRIWSRDAQGVDQLFALGQVGIGAIYIGGIEAPFTLKDANNQTTGQIQKVSVFARDDGSVGTVQQLDVVV